MTRPIVSPVSLPAKQAAHSTDIYDLQRRIPPVPDDPTSPPVFQFSHPGTVTTGLFGRNRYPQPTVARLIIVDLLTAGSSDTVIEFTHNGSAFVTVTVASGSDNEVVEIGEFFASPYDYLQAEITSAGTGAADMSIHVFTNR